MHRLVSTFVVALQQDQAFLQLGPYSKDLQIPGPLLHPLSVNFFSLLLSHQLKVWLCASVKYQKAVKPVLSRHSKRRPKIGFQYRLSLRPKIGFQDQLPLNAGQKYCRMLQVGAFFNNF